MESSETIKSHYLNKIREKIDINLEKKNCALF